MDDKLKKETAEVLTNVGEAYVGYLDSMISMFESMLTPEQLEEVEKELQKREKDEK